MRVILRFGVPALLVFIIAWSFSKWPTAIVLSTLGALAFGGLAIWFSDGLQKLTHPKPETVVGDSKNSEEIEAQLSIFSDSLKNETTKVIREFIEQIHNTPQTGDDIKKLVKELAIKAHIINDDARRIIELEKFRLSGEESDFPDWGIEDNKIIMLRCPETVHAEESLCHPDYFRFSFDLDNYDKIYPGEFSTFDDAAEDEYLKLGFEDDYKTQKTGILSLDIDKFKNQIQTKAGKKKTPPFRSVLSEKVCDMTFPDNKKPRAAYFRHGLIKNISDDGSEWEITRRIRIEFI